MLLVTLGTLSMPGGRGVRFAGVAALALLDHVPGVRLVATRALPMGRGGAVKRGCVTALTAYLQSFRSVRQTTVTTFTAGMSREPLGAVNLIGVARLADRSVRLPEQERVGLMALLAADGRVKIGVRGGRLVARAASSREAVTCPSRGMGIVAADARAGHPSLRVVRVNALVAARAGLFGRAAHVVRRMAGGAAPVLGHLRGGEDANVLVTRAALDGFLALERMRAVATDAFGVSAREESRSGHLGLVRRVAFGASGPGIGRGRVLVVVTGGAYLDARLSDRGVGGRDVLVAAVACAGLGSLVLVRAVALHALARSVHRHGGDLALLGRVAAIAVFGARNQGNSAVER